MSGQGFRVVERYSIAIPFYDEFHELTYGDMVSQMILTRLEKGDATGDDLVRELGVDYIEVYLDKLVDKKLVINNGSGTYSLNINGLPS